MMRTLLVICLLALGGLYQLLPAQVRINEVLADNLFKGENHYTGEGGDWLELYHAGSQSQSFIGLFLSDDASNLSKWKFPSHLVMQPGDYLVVLADGIDSIGDKLHLNFKLDKQGEVLYLYSATDGILDSLVFPRMYVNDSYGWDAQGKLAYFDKPTPGKANDEGSAYRVAPTPVLHQAGGIYPGGLSVSMEGVAGGRIHYTLDGSIPQLTDPVYTAPLEITESRAVRARQWLSGAEPGESATATYVVHPGHSLPVVALTSNPDGLWSDESGIYVTGKNGIPGNCSESPKNWNQDWERRTHLEYVDREGHLQVAKDGGMKIHGGCSRTEDLKSMAFIARNRYGGNEINHPFFRSKEVDHFKALVLRNAGNDSRYTFIRDAVIMSSVEGMDLDQQAYEPVVVYLNGDYHGIMNLREKANEHWVTSNYGLDPDSLDFLENGRQVFAGTSQAYDQLTSFLESNSLASESNFQWVAERLDISSYMDYLITQMFYANRDWPGNNQKIWRDRHNNGKWRFLMFDLEFSMGLYDFDPSLDMFSFSTADDVDHWPNPTWSTLPIRRVLENPGFRDEFIRRYLIYLNTTLSSERVIAVIDSLQAGISQEFPAHTQRWGYIPSMNGWEARIDQIRSFATQRPAHVLTNMKNFFGLGEPITLEVAPSAPFGQVLLNGVAVPEEGMEGSYLVGVDLQLDFQPASGYRLKHWELTSVQARDTLLLPRTSSWRYNDSGTFPGPDWTSVQFDDSSWPQGAAELGYGDGGEATLLDYGPDAENKHITYYFRKRLDLEATDMLESYTFQLMRDDGAVIHVNGQEVLRVNMPDGNVLPETTASTFAGGSEESSYFTHALDELPLQEGTNVIAVEIHQSSPGSSDISFDLELGAGIKGSEQSQVLTSSSLRINPGYGTRIKAVCEALEIHPHILINEIMAAGEQDWIELYNQGSESVDLAGAWLTDDLSQPEKWQFPRGHADLTSLDPGHFLVLTADEASQGNPLNLNFRLASEWESVGLSYRSGEDLIWLDSLSYGQQYPVASWGRYPDGSDAWTRLELTAGKSNRPSTLGLRPHAAGRLQLYPNPVRDLLHVRIPPGKDGGQHPWTLKVLDLSGRQLMHRNLAPEAAADEWLVNTSPWPGGLYLLVLENGQDRYTGRFMVVP